MTPPNANTPPPSDKDKKISLVTPAPVIVPLGDDKQNPATKLDESSPEFREKSRAFESGANTVLRIPVGICRKIVERKAKKIFPEDSDKIDALVEEISVSDESIKSAKESLARIIARRCKSGEALDIAALTSFGIELTVGFGSVMRELKEMEKRIAAKQNKTT